MTRDKIMRIALEAGLQLATDVNWMPIIRIEYLESFAKLVLINTDPNSFMSYQEGAEAGRLAEREACAKVCDAMEEKAEGTECCKWPTPIDCAHAIRARGQA
jgi:hypothetical protein